MTFRTPLPRAARRPQASGFTLIELMIVVAVIGILAAIAYPNYQEYVRKTNRTAAKSFLMDLIQRQQQYLLDNREYADDLATLGMSAPADVTDHYSVTEPFTVAATPPKVTVTLVATGRQAADGNLSLSSSGERTGRW